MIEQFLREKFVLDILPDCIEIKTYESLEVQELLDFAKEDFEIKNKIDEELFYKLIHGLINENLLLKLQKYLRNNPITQELKELLIIENITDYLSSNENFLQLVSSKFNEDQVNKLRNVYHSLSYELSTNNINEQKDTNKLSNEDDTEEDILLDKELRQENEIFIKNLKEITINDEYQSLNLDDVNENIRKNGLKRFIENYKFTNIGLDSLICILKLSDINNIENEKKIDYNLLKQVYEKSISLRDLLFSIELNNFYILYLLLKYEINFDKQDLRSILINVKNIKSLKESSLYEKNQKTIDLIIYLEHKEIDHIEIKSEVIKFLLDNDYKLTSFKDDIKSKINNFKNIKINEIFMRNKNAILPNPDNDKFECNITKEPEFVVIEEIQNKDNDFEVTNQFNDSPTKNLVSLECELFKEVISILEKEKWYDSISKEINNASLIDFSFLNTMTNEEIFEINFKFLKEKLNESIKKPDLLKISNFFNNIKNEKKTYKFKSSQL